MLTRVWRGQKNYVINYVILWRVLSRGIDFLVRIFSLNYWYPRRLGDFGQFVTRVTNWDKQAKLREQIPYLHVGNIWDWVSKRILICLQYR